MARSRKTKMLRHVRVYHYFMQTAAWRSLKALERAIYIEIAARYAGDGSNNGRIGYSIREAASTFKVGKSSAARALETLQDRGFIVARKKGAFSLKSRHSTEWRLTEFGCDLTGALPTKEFARWSPENQKPVPTQTLRVPQTGPAGASSGTGRFERPLTVSSVGPRTADSRILGSSTGTHIGYQGERANQARRIASEPPPPAVELVLAKAAGRTPDETAALLRSFPDASEAIVEIEKVR